MQFAGLGAVAFVDEDEELAFGGGESPGGQVAFDLFDIGLEIGVAEVVATAELVDQRTDQPFCVGVENADEVGTAFGAVDILADA